MTAPLTSPILPLRAAIRSACLGDATLAGLMGGTVRLDDEPARGAEPLYAAFGDGAARDWSTSTDRGHEQDLAIAVWARPGSAATALRVADRMAALLDEADLALLGHRLVRLTVAETETVRDPKSDLTRVTLRLRALTERQP